MLTLAMTEKIEQAFAEIAKIRKRNREYIRERQMRDDWNGEDIEIRDSDIDYWHSVIAEVYDEEDAQDQAAEEEARRKQWCGEWCGECFYEGELKSCTCGG
jgi:hypothetical protein